ncbi:hypothetical protein [Anaplasma platys]|uniref:hypothetical protein n=1 Tax=Anaplasma platys TaxID=949 RepID=UPI00145C9694|nr:hypothetical protein [Anaplasma platys]
MFEEQKRKLRLLLNNTEALRAYFDMVCVVSALLLMLMCTHYAAIINADTTLFYLLSFLFFFVLAAVPIVSDTHKMLNGYGKETSNARTAMMTAVACFMGISFFYILSKMANAYENPLPTMSACGFILCYCINLCCMVGLPGVWLVARLVEHDMYKRGIYGSDSLRDADSDQSELKRVAEDAVSEVPADEAVGVHDSDMEKSTDVDQVFVSQATLSLDTKRQEEELSL